MEKIFKSVMALTIALAMVACGGNANNCGRKSYSYIHISRPANFYGFIVLVCCFGKI